MTNSSGTQIGFVVNKKNGWKKANWRPNVTVTVESVTTLPVSLAHDGCMCIHPETHTKGCEEERLSRRDKNVSEVSSFYFFPELFPPAYRSLGFIEYTKSAVLLSHHRSLFFENE